MMRIESPCPAVASRPVRAPRRSTSRLVPTVVPRLKRSVEAIRSGTVVPQSVGQRRQSVEHAHREVVLGGGGLRVVQPAVLVHGRAVGERASSVDSDVVAHPPALSSL